MIRRIEMCANVSIIVAALAFCATIIKDRWINSPANVGNATAATEGRLLSARLQIPGIQWGQTSMTLVMALSTACHFCQESTPFYRVLATSRAVTSKRVSIMMVFPQPQGEAEAFVKDHDINATQVLSMPLQKFGISSTPTLLLVDRNGKVEKLWIGVLSPLQQKNVVDELSKLS
jgi:hypothetical protein